MKKYFYNLALRFKFAGLALFVVFIGFPLYVLINVFAILIIPTALLDIPIWLVSGKTPFNDLQEYLREFA